MQQHLLTHKLQYFWKARASWFRGARGGPSGCCPQHRKARSRAPSCPAAGRRGSRQQLGWALQAQLSEATASPGKGQVHGATHRLGEPRPQCPHMGQHQPWGTCSRSHRKEGLRVPCCSHTKSRERGGRNLPTCFLFDGLMERLTGILTVPALWIDFKGCLNEQPPPDREILLPCPNLLKYFELPDPHLAQDFGKRQQRRIL